jgi:site-specific recombinase XerD
MTLIAPTLQSFFTDRLTRQRQASPRTIAAYRDTVRLLLTHVHEQCGKLPSQLDWDDLNASVISAFLYHLELERNNSTRTRNVRLTAIRSLFSYAALRHPEHASLIQRVLAIPPKRFDKRIMTFLTPVEVDALLAAPDQSRWEGRRDRAMMLLAIQTGLRVSELTGLNCGDVTLGTGGSIRCEGKGRKQRAIPLSAPAATLLQSWLRERAGCPADPLFPTRTGRRLSRDAVALRVSTHAATAAHRCPSLVGPPPRAAPQLRDVAAARRRRYLRDRPLARPRGRPINRRVRPRRHQHQGESPVPHHPSQGTARPIPPDRQGTRIPGKPVTMPRETPRTQLLSTLLGIVAVSA